MKLNDIHPAAGSKTARKRVGRGIGRGVAEGMGAAGATVVCSARTRSQLDEAVAAIEAAGGSVADKPAG